MSSSKAIISGALKALSTEISAYLCKDLCRVESEICGSRLKKCIAYATEGGKFVRSSLTYDTYKTLRPSSTAEELHAASQVAATLELLQAYFLVIDDIIDDADMRRGKSCWWRLPEIGMVAINDATLLNSTIDWVVRNAVPKHPKLTTMMEEIAEVRLNTHIGEMLDCMEKKPEDFNWALYNKIVDKKSSDYSYYLPLALGYHLAEVSFNEQTMRNFSNKTGRLFQAHNDVLDCYASGEGLGKSGKCEDLAEGKCSWVVCRALEKLAGDQHRLDTFLRHLGRPEPEHVGVASAIIHELGIRDDFYRHMTSEMAQLHADIDAWEEAAPLRRMLHKAVDSIKVDKYLG